MTSESPFVRRSIFQSPVLMLRFVGGRLPAPIAVLVTSLAAWLTAIGAGRLIGYW